MHSFGMTEHMAKTQNCNTFCLTEGTRSAETYRKRSRVTVREFLSSAQVGDLRTVYQNFARSEGRTSKGFRPSKLDPLWLREKWRENPKEKPEILGIFSEDKLTARNDDRLQTSGGVWWAIAGMSRTGYMHLSPPISREEVGLAAESLPAKRAVGPDVFPAEFYKKCEDPNSVPATLFTRMMKCGKNSSGTEAIFRGPLDKAGKDPTRCGNRRPRDLSNPFMKLLELETARRMPPMLEGEVAESPYAYQKGRSTEIILADQKGRLFDLRGGFGHRGGIR